MIPGKLLDLASGFSWTTAIKIVAPILFVVGVYFWADHSGYHRAEIKYTTQIGKLESDLDASNRSLEYLQTQIAQQNASVDSLKAQSDARAKAAQDALSEAEKRSSGLAAQVDRLKASAKAPKGDGCHTSDALKAGV